MSACDSNETPPKKNKVEDVLEIPKPTSSDEECEETELSNFRAKGQLKDSLKLVRKCYKVDMPRDFELFWKFCCQRNPNKPTEALKSTLGLLLVGPFDVLSNPKLSKDNDIAWLLHYRYFYDPPEFTTLIVKSADKKLGHWGYVRDSPSQLPSLVAHNEAGKGGRFSISGDNLFAAVLLYAKGLPEDSDVKKLIQDLEAWAEKHDLCLEPVSDKIRKRNKKSVTKTLSGLGLVVPVSEDDVGYRPLPETLRSLQKILERIAACKDEKQRLEASEPLDEIITFIQFANDEGDFGEGVELGLDLLAFEKSELFNSQIEMLLAVGYELLGYNLFAESIKLHLKKRTRGGRVSQTWGRS